MTKHLSDQVTALAALTFSDWLLKGIDEAVCENIQAMTQTLQSEDWPETQAACEADRAISQVSADDLKRAWTRAFCAGSGSVTPHRSVALTGLVMQEPRDEALRLMEKFGLAPRKDIHEPADHLGVLLAFWARLLLQPETVETAVEFARGQLDWVPWVREQLAATQADNTTTLALLRLLECVLADFLRKNQR